ncbi:hypothetical protein [Parvularcula sp. IMCC14364]|uniref:hypothetical protein n=1 Tax=Parvularcula sp. IMCC14364 TaxID=3067902 RepID=UPI0027408292|nr:hypothetical protein [Parvularcula sp. IMCC14364]
MAKAETKQTPKVVEMARNGWLAYIGMYGAAFERLQPRLEKLNLNTGDVWNELVAKGEAMEDAAQERIQEVRERAEDRYGDQIERVRELMPKAGKDSSEVEVLHDEIAELNKQITSLKRKVTSLDKAVKAA